MTDAQVKLQAERLLNLALDIVMQARLLLESAGNSTAQGGSIGDGGTVTRATAVPDNDPPSSGYPLTAIHKLMGPGNDASILRAEFSRRRIHMRLGSAGRIGAEILLRLLEQPGEFISHEELAKSAGLRSPSSNAIKVYICYLRNALEEHGYSPMMIETGRRSYALSADALPDVMEFLSRP